VKVIPAIDIKDGRCVRLFKGRFDDVTEYAFDPAELASRYRDLGARWIHCVDLDGARRGRAGNLEQIGRIVAAIDGGVQVGGGIRDDADIVRLLDMGIDRVVVGSVAVEQPDMAGAWLREIGTERIVLALDVKFEGEDATPVLVSRGWTEASRTSLWEALDRFAADGLRHVLCTDIGRDGAMTGPAVELYSQCAGRYPDIRFQASGGVRHAQDLAALSDAGAAAAIVGKALLDGRITDEELQPFLRNA